MSKDLMAQLRAFKPCCPQEERDKAMMLYFLENTPDCFLRDNMTAHFTASAWIVNKERTGVLFCYHNIYNSWSWVGGHADGEKMLSFVAEKEALEETGVQVKRVGEEIFSLEILPVAGHMKKGEYVSSHLHYNVTYLFEADDRLPVRIKEDENSAVGWIAFERVEEMSTEKWMCESIYRKLIAKSKK